jgi:Outer membrane protein beta-barrel domain
MRNPSVVTTVLVASLAVGVRAQTASGPASAGPASTATHETSDPPKWGIFAGYSSIETNNHNFHFNPDITFSALDYDENGHGFEIGGVRNLNRYLGIVGLFDAHFSSNSFTLGVVPLGSNQFTFVPNCTQSPCTAQGFALNPSLFRFTAGPEVAFRNRTRVTPFADVLFGVAHSHATFSTAGPALTLSRIEAENGFAVNFAAGLEFRVARQISFRGSIDYGKVFVGSNALPSQLVDSVGFSAGVLFRFH